MNVEQRKAIAIASARRRAAEAARPVDSRGGLLGNLDALIRGVADTVTLGTMDEISAGTEAALNPIIGTGEEGESFSDRYAANVAKQRATDEADAANRPWVRGAGQVGGGVLGALGLVRSGLSLAANTARSGGSLGKTAVASAVEGGILGGLHGAGSGTSLEDRAEKAVTGGAFGFGLGGVAPYAVAAAAPIVKSVANPILARLYPEEYAQSAMGEAVRRSGMSGLDVANMLRGAADDAQPFMLADALGHSGQRLLSTTARVPHNERQAVVETLQNRQAGQGRRITGALAEAFDAPDTAAQRAARLTRERGEAADAAYTAARADAGAVDVTPALQIIDEFVSPGAIGVVSQADNIAADTVEGVLLRARRLLTDGRSNLTDWNAVHRAKMDLDDMIGVAERGGKNRQMRQLIRVRNAVDAALSDASDSYAGARDAFAQASRTIDAVETGATAARRGRPDDTIPAFRNMTPEEQAAFRAGYVDPLIEGTQSAAVGVNKARPLINDATAQEFAAFAAPRRAPQLGRRLSREQRMFETTQAALGGSKTADNLADAADMSKFDPGVLTKLVQGRPVAAAVEAVTKLLTEARGQPPAVIERVARMLLETNPAAAQRIVDSASRRRRMTDNMRALITALTVSEGAAAAGRAY
jgi:hypothetical protein